MTARTCRRPRTAVRGAALQFLDDRRRLFGHQPHAAATSPTPSPLLENLTRCVIEILAGARDLEQIARWVTDDVYRHLLEARRARRPGPPGEGPGAARGRRSRIGSTSRTVRAARRRRRGRRHRAPAARTSARSRSGSRVSTSAGGRRAINVL